MMRMMMMRMMMMLSVEVVALSVSLILDFPPPSTSSSVCILCEFVSLLPSFKLLKNFSLKNIHFSGYYIYSIYNKKKRRFWNFKQKSFWFRFLESSVR